MHKLYSFRYPLVGVLALAWRLSAGPALAAETASDRPKPVPATRPEVKTALEALKRREPRLPLPPPTEEERKNAGEWGLVNNGRMRGLYLPKSWLSTNFGPDPAMTIDTVFKTQCFWIVSRGNNCQYCLGHQEHRLGAMMGLSDNRIASLDADWSVFLPKEQAAFALARKLTLSPHTVGEADVEALRPHFDGKQIVELVYTIAFFNSINRWTDGLGIPQDETLRDEPVRFDAPTDARFLEAPSLTAPSPDAARPALESRAEVEAAWSACRARAPRAPLATEDEARAVLPAALAKGPLPQWVRAMSLFPKAGVGQVQGITAMFNEGRVDNVLKAQIAWTCARHNRAWYSLDYARRRLADLGQTSDRAFALDAPGKPLSEGAQTALAFAKRSTVSPATIADADIASLREHFSDRETAEIVYVVCAQNMFDRFTETLGLPLEAE